jgi:hypothetical protein
LRSIFFYFALWQTSVLRTFMNVGRHTHTSLLSVSRLDSGKSCQIPPFTYIMRVVTKCFECLHQNSQQNWNSLYIYIYP